MQCIHHGGFGYSYIRASFMGNGDITSLIQVNQFLYAMLNKELFSYVHKQDNSLMIVLKNNEIYLTHRTGKCHRLYYNIAFDNVKS